ncbi:hypothetical protein [Caulobacter soli]|uniref:hypothetical protein n=1 Tax=Caulobacter soli TaxID=2708539 RepID=UPI0013EB3E66|nr:hypothetical protein [Caulobacter soli]
MRQAAAMERGSERAGGEIAILNPLVGEITEALLDLGGAAHRDLVVAYVAKRRGVYRPSEAMRRELDEAFAAYCRGASDPRAASLLHLPYGPHSHRWALTDQAYGMLRGQSGAEVR